MVRAEHVVSLFSRRFGGPPAGVVRAPGRINIIGEHTDYNDGFVLPMAIDRAIYLAFRKRDDRRVVLRAHDFDEEAAFSLDALVRGEAMWLEYVKGVARVSMDEGYAPEGWEGVVSGDIPVGAGLSSSAALELAAAYAFTAESWDPVRVARIAQRAENEWLGMPCGIMDQLACAAGRDGHALLLDCRSLQYEAVPTPAGAAFVVLDTGTRRELVHSAYRERREACERAARALGAASLRDVDAGTLARRGDALDPIARRRAAHVVSENTRVLAAARAMRAGDTVMLGRLMNESHRSLRDDFEVSSPALDAMVDAARCAEGCFGARMTGAGFGGCAIALVDRNRVEAFSRQVETSYRTATGIEPRIYACRATNGTELVEHD